MHFWIDKRNPHIRCCHTTALGPRRRPPALLSWSFATSSVANSSSSSRREARSNLRNQHRGRTSSTRRHQSSSFTSGSAGDDEEAVIRTVAESQLRRRSGWEVQGSFSTDEGSSSEDFQEGYRQELERPPSYEEVVEGFSGPAGQRQQQLGGVQAISGTAGAGNMVNPVHRYQQVESFWEQGRRCSELASLRRSLSARRGRGGPPYGPGGRRHQAAAVPGTAVRAGSSSRVQTTDGFSYQDFGQHAAVIHAVRNGGAHVEIDTNSLLIEAGLIDARDEATTSAVNQHQEYLLQQQRLQQSVARLVNEARLSGNAAKPLNCIIWTCFMALALFVVPAQMFYGNHTEFFFFFVVPLGLLVTGFCVAIKQYFFPKSESPHRHSPRPVTQTVLTAAAEGNAAVRTSSNRMAPPVMASSTSSAQSTPLAAVPPIPTTITEEDESISISPNQENGPRPPAAHPSNLYTSSSSSRIRRINRHQQTTATVSSDAATSTQGSRTDIDEASISNINNGPNRRQEHAMLTVAAAAAEDNNDDDDGHRRRHHHQSSPMRIHGSRRLAAEAIMSPTSYSVSVPDDVDPLMVELDGISSVAVEVEGLDTLSPLSDEVNDPPPYHLAILMPNPSSVAGTPMGTSSSADGRDGLNNSSSLPGVHLSNVIMVDCSSRLIGTSGEQMARRGAENEVQGCNNMVALLTRETPAVQNKGQIILRDTASPPPPYEKSIGKELLDIFYSSTFSYRSSFRKEEWTIYYMYRFDY